MINILSAIMQCDIQWNVFNVHSCLFCGYNSLYNKLYGQLATYYTVSSIQVTTVVAYVCMCSHV